MKFNLRKYSQQTIEFDQPQIDKKVDQVQTYTDPVIDTSIQDQDRYQIENVLNGLFDQISKGKVFTKEQLKDFANIRQSPYFNIVFNKLAIQYGENVALKAWQSLGYNIQEESTAFTQTDSRSKTPIENAPEDIRVGEPTPTDTDKKTRRGILSNMQGMVETTPSYDLLLDKGVQKEVAQQIKQKIQEIIELKREMNTANIARRVKGDKTSVYLALSEEVSPELFDSKIQAYLPQNLREDFIKARNIISRKWNLDPYVTRLLILADIENLQRIDTGEYMVASLLGLAYNTGPYSRLVFRPDGQSVIQRYTDKRLTWLFNHPQQIPMNLQMILENNVGMDWGNRKSDTLNFIRNNEEAKNIAEQSYQDLIQKGSIIPTIVNWSTWYGLRELLKNTLSQQVESSLQQDIVTEDELQNKDISELKQDQGVRTRELLKQINEIADTLTTSLKSSTNNPVSNFRLSQIIDIYKDLLIESLEYYIHGTDAKKTIDDKSLFANLSNKVTASPINKRKRQIGLAMQTAHELINNQITGENLLFSVARVLSGGNRPDMLSLYRAGELIKEYKTYPLDQDDFLDTKSGWFFKNDKDIKTKLSESFAALREPLMQIYNSGKYDPRIIKVFMEAIKFKPSYFDDGKRYSQDRELYESLISGDYPQEIKNKYIDEKEGNIPKYMKDRYEDDTSTNYDEFEEDQAKMYGLASKHMENYLLKMSKVNTFKQYIQKLNINTKIIDDYVSLVRHQYNN